MEYKDLHVAIVFSPICGPKDKSDAFRIRPSSKPGEGAVLTFDNVPAWILLTVMSLLLGKGH